METQKHILSILQLYEFSMALGKTLEFDEVCSDFLKLVLKRKNLSAAWILDIENEDGRFVFSLPKTKNTTIKLEKSILENLNSSEKNVSCEIAEVSQQIIPIDLTSGYLIKFKLSETRFLFLYSKIKPFTVLEYNQLKPVIHKFSVTLEACDVYKSKNELLNKLEVQNKELSEYAHMVSHDLKSPLRSIDTMSSWLKEDHEKDLGEDGVQKIEQIRNNVEKMDALIGGILDYSTVGKNRKHIDAVDLNILLQDLIGFIDIPNHITVSVVNNLPSVKGDKHRLQQLFQNLIVNAIACNDKEVGWVKIGYNHNNEFFVQDNSKGIEKPYLDKIFKAFFKLENNPKSVGLGLSIVKKIVELHQGKIWIDSKIKEGTTFFFTLNNQQSNGAA